MARKAVDPRVPTLINNGVQQRHRSLFLMVGDRGHNQVLHLYDMLKHAKVATQPSVLWCYKKELNFITHRKKREKKITKDVKSGKRPANDLTPFEAFLAQTDIRYTYYKESHKVLGNTYGMCVLQDFEALTPNLLARTVETVEGGGIVVILLKTMASLKQLYTMTMDVHARYRTEAHQDVVARFNERFLLSLTQCESCLVIDDELNVLPVSLGRAVKPLAAAAAGGKGGRDGADGDGGDAPHVRELRELKQSLKDTQPVGTLVGAARTLDQAKAVMTFVDAIAEKTLRSTVALTAARGRGKSAALGLGIAAAVAYGYSNIFVTSPTPENLRTLFQFVFAGFKALGYEEHLDYDVLRGANEDTKDTVVRVNIKRQHRQTIQYVLPQDHQMLAQAELLVIDEAAAIPLPLVRQLLGPYLVFMASTINGYEGTGRSLSLKLIEQLRMQSQGFSNSANSGTGGTGGSGSGAAAAAVAVGGRSLREVTLEEPIRYAPGDVVESWLNRLLCLDASIVARNIQGFPDPKQCKLFVVSRDTLFSYHPVSELFLQRMMALYVASHYKNTPDDLQLMSDAPSHRLFVLLPPTSEKDTSIPDPLVVIQVSHEGAISRQSVQHSLERGIRASGDLIPWTVSQQFQDNDFATMSGARVVRIATHPSYIGKGYGRRAMELLEQFYRGEFQSLDEAQMDAQASIDDEDEISARLRVSDDALAAAAAAGGKDGKDGASRLLSESLGVRDIRTMPPLFLRLDERKSPRLHYLGVSFGLTPELHRFWKRLGYAPVYLRQTENDLTGEHTCIVLKALNRDGLSVQVAGNWLDAYTADFRRRFMELLSYSFKHFPAPQALSIMESAVPSASAAAATAGGAPAPAAAASGGFSYGGAFESAMDGEFTARDLHKAVRPHDMKRLESYANNMVDYHLILDLLPRIAPLIFNGAFSRQLAAPSSIVSAKSAVSGGGGEDDMYSPVVLTGIQSSLVLGIGLQRKSVDDLEKEMSLPAKQILALFIKVIRKVSNRFRAMEVIELAQAGSDGDSDGGSDDDGKARTKRRSSKKSSSKTKSTGTGKRALPTPMTINVAPGDAAADDAWDRAADFSDDDRATDEAGRAAIQKIRSAQSSGDSAALADESDPLKRKQREMVNSILKSDYAIRGEEQQFEAMGSQVLKNHGKSGASTVVSVKRSAEDGDGGDGDGTGDDGKKTKKHKKHGIAEGLAAAEAKYQAKQMGSKVSKKTRRG